MQLNIPFLEKDTEIQNARSPTTIFQSMLKTINRLTSSESNVPQAPSPGCVAVMPTRRDVVAATCTQRGCRVGDIYIYSGGEWLFPPLTHPSQEDGIFCLRWMPLSDILLVGTSTGVAMWSLCALCDRQTDKSWVNLLNHPRGRPVHDIQVCPTGRLFAALSRGESDVIVFDSCMKTATPLRSIRGSRCAEMAWSPSGNAILVGTHSGELVLFDANSWERNDSNVYELGGEIASLCWLTQTGCLVAAARSMHVYSYISRGGAAATSTSAGSIGVFSGRHDAAIQNFPVVMSPIPLVLDAEPLSSILEASSIPWKDFFIADMKSELSSGLVAVSFSCSLEDREDTVIVPAVVVYLTSLSPQLNMTALRVISFDSFNIDGVSMAEQQPISFELRGPKSSSGRRGTYSNGNGSSRLGFRDKGSSGLSGARSFPDFDSDRRLVSATGTPKTGAGGSSLLSKSGASLLAVLWGVGTLSIDECTP